MTCCDTAAMALKHFLAEELRQLARVTRTFGDEHFGTEPALLGERRGLLGAHASHVATSTSP